MLSIESIQENIKDVNKKLERIYAFREELRERERELNAKKVLMHEKEKEEKEENEVCKRDKRLIKGR